MSMPNEHEIRMLCVGGPLDGQRYVADKRYQMVALRVPKPVSIDFDPQYSPRNVATENTDMAVYAVTSVRTDVQSIYFLRIATMTMVDSICVLLNRYPGQ